jgi:hypothetical protein
MRWYLMVPIWYQSVLRIAARTIWALNGFIFLFPEVHYGQVLIPDITREGNYFVLGGGFT